MNGASAAWIHEIKHDRFRILARRVASGVQLITRNGCNFADRFKLALGEVMPAPIKRQHQPVSGDREDHHDQRQVVVMRTSWTLIPLMIRKPRPRWEANISPISTPARRRRCGRHG